MPIYEYECEACGSFELMKPMSQAAQRGDCPSCGIPAERVMSMPQIRLMAPMARKAAERNEKSRHEPHVCTSGCGHSHGSRTTAAAKTGQRQQYTGSRPWVIEHR